MRILAVDDKAMPRKVLARAVAEAAPDAELAVCASAAEALALPGAGGIDVAFIDIDMPDMNGIALARELKKLNPRVNVVFATGYGEYMADAFELHSSGYLMKPVTALAVATELDNLRFPPAVRDDGRLIVRCFGDFEVFAGGKALAFGRSKAKELLAFLVDRRGAVVSVRTVEAALWEDQPKPGPSTGSYLRTLVADLQHTLDACGHGDVLVRRRGELGVDVAKVSCDYYAYLQEDPASINRWRGEYMRQYAWAETTKAALLNDY